MPLTVRLDSSLEAELDRYCTERGLTRSRVMRDSLAAYLVAGGRASAAMPATLLPPLPGGREPSAAFKAFQQSGLLGGGVLGGVSADKHAVRARAMQRIRRSSV